MPESTKNPPIVVLRDGALKVTIWANEAENGSYLSSAFARTYTKDGQPKDAHTFGRNDLLPLAELARRAYLKTGRSYLPQSSDEKHRSPDAE